VQFDHFADESQAGEEMLQLEKKLEEKSMMKEIIRAEQERLEGEGPEEEVSGRSDASQEE